MAAQSLVRDEWQRSTAAALPAPDQLAALGAVLCLYRAYGAGELGGWMQSVRAAACSDLDSDGLHESLLFFDRDGRCCWRLYLLPDSDFLAWEQLSAVLPDAPSPAQGEGIAERLWLRLAGRLRGERWEGAVLRLHAVTPAPASASGPVLAASLPPLSSAGLAVAQRILRRHGTGHDDCCCLQAATAQAERHRANDDGTSFPLIRFHLGEHA